MRLGQTVSNERRQLAGNQPGTVAIPRKRAFAGNLRRRFLLRPRSKGNERALARSGAITALITKATGKEPYVVGKPNPMMFRSALNRIGAHSESTGMIGDRMDTDIVAGIEAGLHTVLVLTGISDRAEIERFPFRPDEILDSIAALLPAESEESEMPEVL